MEKNIVAPKFSAIIHVKVYMQLPLEDWICKRLIQKFENSIDGTYTHVTY